MPDLNSVQAAVLAHLEGASAVTDIVPVARILDGWPDEHRTIPAPRLILEGGDQDFERFDSGEIFAEDVGYSLTVLDTSKSQLRTLVGACKDALDAAEIIAAGWRAATLEVEAVSPRVYDTVEEAYRHEMTLVIPNLQPAP